MDGQAAAAVFAGRTAGAHAAAGCGGFQRLVSVGGAAYGMPRNEHDAPLSRPSTSPFVVDARHETGARCVVPRNSRGATDTTTAAVAIIDHCQYMESSAGNGRWTRRRPLG